MLHVILYIQMSPLVLVVLPQLLYYLVLHPRSRMYTVLNVITSLQTHMKIPLSSEGLLINYSVTEAKLSLAIKLKTSYEHFVLISGNVNHTSTTRIVRNDATRPLRTLLIASSIVLGHLHSYGYFAYSMFVTYKSYVQHVYRHGTVN
jgi:hypothetical protein